MEILTSTVCPELCPYDSALLKNSTLCSNCKTFKKISYNNTCIDACPNNTVYDPEGNTCNIPLLNPLNSKGK